MKRFRLFKKLDLYIISKFLGTFFYAIALIIGISIVFDISENIDEFIENEAPLRAIVFDYYFNFIPYFANLFSGLFTFIAVIFFTSKMAFNSEIIAILSSGVSFWRFVRPYLISAGFIALFSYTLGNFVIPSANEKMTNFKYDYVKGKTINRDRDIHRQIEPNIYIYMERYDANNDYGRKFSIEKFEDDRLVSKLTSDFIRWDRDKKIWTITNYSIREINGYEERITSGSKIDTTLAMTPEEFKTRKDDTETMNLFELLEFIELQKLRGVDAIEQYEIERHRRSAGPFSAFILSIIGVALASRKIRGGLGLHLGIGLALAFTYIMFQQITKIFALSGAISPLLSMWLPNIIFGIVAFFLYRWASR
ncbi:LptF/LptG family permease [Roseimarinus sediminis]|uniref:LptF/LptG family permease n=1 Tax=Roseimarinus sediminis TaxID=1610899 RepID=UPI003D1EFF9E